MWASLDLARIPLFKLLCRHTGKMLRLGHCLGRFPWIPALAFFSFPFWPISVPTHYLTSALDPVDAFWTIPTNTSPLLLFPTGLEQAVAALFLSFPVYRHKIRPWREEPSRNKQSSQRLKHLQGFWWVTACWNSTFGPGKCEKIKILVPFQY